MLTNAENIQILVEYAAFLMRLNYLEYFKRKLESEKCKIEICHFPMNVSGLNSFNVFLRESI